MYSIQTVWLLVSLDLGDFKTLIESVQGAIDEEEAREMAQKWRKTISP